MLLPLHPPAPRTWHAAAAVETPLWFRLSPLPPWVGHAARVSTATGLVLCLHVPVCGLVIAFAFVPNF